MHSIVRHLVALVVYLGLCHAVHGGGLKPVSLRTEGRADPLGLDTAQPRLSWQLESSQRGDRQTAYRIRAATTADALDRGEVDLWDTGKVASDESIQILYAGEPLRSSQQVFWKVQVWDANDELSVWSKPASFETALLSPADWQAQWITRPSSSGTDPFADDPAPLLRKTFAIKAGKTIKRARVYVSGLGYYELSLNGNRVGDHVLDPGWTAYSKRVLYSTYDVTDQLKAGTNALGLMLGNGWFNPLPLRMWGRLNIREHLTVGAPRAILQLQIEYADGTTQTIVSDESWRTAAGPILRNSVYLGEVYDARREIPEWDTPGFDESNWQPVSVAREPEVGTLRAQTAPPIRITRTLKPIGITEPAPGTWIFDFGQNFAGWARLHVKGPAGTRVTMRFGELLYPDGTLNGMTSVCGQIKAGGKDYRYDGDGAPRTAFQQNVYVLKGEGEETYTPRFTFHGFRYVELTGFPGTPDLNALEGLRLNSDVTPAGSFECSNDLFNRIQDLVLWTELSNLFSVQSDCPHREKFGYGGDIVASSEMAMLNFDMATFYAKAVQDLADAVRPNGGFTETAPFVGISDKGMGEGAGPVGWGTAHPLLLWQLYQYYGDRRLVEDQYEAAKGWVALLEVRAQDGILDNGISDHESLVPKPRALTGTAFFYFNQQLLARLARIIGREQEATEAEQKAESIRMAFNKRFLNRTSGRYDTGTQACQAFALYFGLVPPEAEANALSVLAADIETRDGHLSTGIFGTKYLLHTLSDHDRADLAWTIANQRTFPGWGHMIENGATTLWEHWAFSDNTFSHNHPMFGSVSEWFYKHVAGIQPAPDAVGFDKIIIRPQPAGDLTWARAHYDSVRGRVATHWEKRGDQFRLTLSVPVGSSARVFLPAKGVEHVHESGKPLNESPGIELMAETASCVELNVGPGDYEFTSTMGS